MRRILGILFWLLIGLYVAALLLLAIGTFGLMGQPPDPLAAVFLIPLGFPWILAVTWFPPGLQPWLGLTAPILNIAILGWLRGRCIHRMDDAKHG